jgi:hypothetical protein
MCIRNHLPPLNFWIVNLTFDICTYHFEVFIAYQCVNYDVLSELRKQMSLFKAIT